ncbi:hypothetical protein [Natrinema thermotolerans]
MGEGRPSSGDDQSDDEWSVPDCPRCGRPVWLVTVSGPGPGIAAPCGCPVAPDLLADDPDRER